MRSAMQVLGSHHLEMWPEPGFHGVHGQLRSAGAAAALVPAKQASKLRWWDLEPKGRYSNGEHGQPQSMPNSGDWQPNHQTLVIPAACFCTWLRVAPTKTHAGRQHGHPSIDRQPSGRGPS